jgi:hypothetical protein
MNLYILFLTIARILIFSPAYLKEILKDKKLIIAETD